uniref:Uncharacterized protein n=1 Tax=Arundo donax TaxID=35708 RepID=A0A0A9CG21_ARUDO
MYMLALAKKIYAMFFPSWFWIGTTIVLVLVHFMCLIREEASLTNACRLFLLNIARFTLPSVFSFLISHMHSIENGL